MYEFWSALEMLPLAMRIGESWWFPLLESVHVLTAMFVIGSVLFVDLRLIGVAAKGYAWPAFSRELLRWTWVAFVLATLTGAGMFITRASWYIENRAFQAKLVLLVLACLNMIVFHVVNRSAASVGDGGGARIAGIASLLCWIGVTLAGRWTGHLS